MTVLLPGGAEPPTTFVPADDNIFGPVGYGVWWLVAGVLAGLCGIGLVWWATRRCPVEAVQPRPVPVNVPALKARYLTTIDGLEREFVTHHLDERELHHRLSRTVREFAADLGEPGAVAMTAAVLEEAGLMSAATVVASYEQPQFKERAASDPATSCDRAKAVIASW